METVSASFYDVLGVQRNATAEEVRKAFKSIVLTKHPDHGGDEAEFVTVQKAYEVLSDGRRRRIYDRFGADALERSSESLFTQGFRGGSFGPDPVGKKNLEAEVEALRRENQSLQRQLMIVKPDTKSAYASSFESWMRNRDPNQIRVITSETIAEEYGVAEESYDPVYLPKLESLELYYDDIGPIGEVVKGKTASLPDRLRWGEVLVAMLATPISPIDHHLATWGYIPGEELRAHPYPAGAQGVGLVVAVGPGVKFLQPRDLVLPQHSQAGCWRKLGVFKEKRLYQLPKTTQAPEVVGNFLAFATGYCLLENYGELLPGDTIIQSNAESFIGQAVIQLCRILQIKTINLVNDREDFDEISDQLNALGATHVWKNTGSILSRIQKGKANLPRLAIDALGGDTLRRIGECLRPDAALVSYGTQTTRVDPFPYAPLLYNNIEIRGFWLYKWLKDNPEGLDELVDKLLPLVEDGKLTADVSTWKQLEESHASALKDKKPNILLQWNTLEEALELAKELETITEKPKEAPKDAN